MKKSKCAPLTQTEKDWIRKLHKLAERCPKSLWLFSASGTLCIMKTPQDGNEHGEGTGGYSVNQENVVGTVSIRNDGGDW